MPMANSIRDISATLPSAEAGPSAAVQGGSVRNSTARSPVNGPEASAGDLAALSSLSDTIRAAIGQASSLSSFRPELVSQLKSAIANQSYTPDPDRVAARVAAAIGKH
jgi:anti-sigma28 factor (negative regulator of flagellin synthesis)